MAKLIDLTGQHFGRWTVIEKAESRNRTVYWKCKCECGTVKNVQGRLLRNGQSTSCGCYHKEISSKILSKIAKNNIKDLLGQVFGDLTVIAPSSKRSETGHAYWICKCSCGKEIEVLGCRLVKNNITHCGCKTITSKGEEKIKQILIQNNINFEQQKIFSTCKFKNTNHPARFDFFINNNYIIEYDGDFHFTTEISGWVTKEKIKITQEHDIYKNQWCKENNIPIIRIPYTRYNQLCLEDLLPETSQFLIK